MVLQCFLLIVFFSNSHGYTKFIYTAKDQVKWVCKANLWQISPKFDNRTEASCTVECDPGASLKHSNLQNYCKCTNYGEVGGKFSSIARNGFFRCGTALDSGFLFPFKLPLSTVTSYIIARSNEEMTTKPEERSSLEIIKGEDACLDCTFNFTTQYANKEFVLYWIKTSKNNSDCVYSYDSVIRAVKYNHHCNVPDELLHRISYQPEGRNTHNIRISNVTESDTGQYLCALQVHIPDQTKGNWKIINNIAVSLNNGGSEPTGNTTDNGPLIRLIVTLPIILALPLVLIGVYLWKKFKTSPRSQATELQIIQNIEDATYVNFGD